jgi:lysophospholipase L1-like esterase
MMHAHTFSRFRRHPPGGVLPLIRDDNATFTDEGSATTGWAATNGTLGVSGSTLRLTKSGAGVAGASKALSLPGTDKDFIVYGRVRMSDAASNHGGAVWVGNADLSKIMAMWLNVNDGSGYVDGNVSLNAYEASTRRSALAASGVDTTVTVDFALQYEQKWSTVNLYFRRASGAWDYKGRVAATWFDATRIDLHLIENAPAGAWIEFDFLLVARPNIIALGDSIAEGINGFSADRSAAKTDYTTTWMYSMNAWRYRRNNLVANQGVGGQVSTSILARVSEATGQSPRVIFVHASSNDWNGGVSQATRTANIRATIDAISEAGQRAVLLNAVYTTAVTGRRDYMRTWWTDYLPTLTGDFAAIDIMRPLITSAGFQNASLTHADALHPNAAGYQAIGEYIATSGYAAP